MVDREEFEKLASDARAVVQRMVDEAYGRVAMKNEDVDDLAGFSIDGPTPGPDWLLMGRGMFRSMVTIPSVLSGKWPRHVGDPDAWEDDIGLIHVSIKEADEMREERDRRTEELKDMAKIIARAAHSGDDGEAPADVPIDRTALVGAFCTVCRDHILALCLKMFEDDDDERSRGKAWHAAEAAVRHWAENR